MEDDLRCYTTFGGRRPSMEDNLQWKTTCGEKATSKQGRRLKFGMLTVLTNIRSSKVLHHVLCIMHHASSTAGMKLRFGMLTVLTNIRSIKVLSSWFIFRTSIEFILIKV